MEFSLFHLVENLMQKQRILFIFHLEENLTAYTGDLKTPKLIPIFSYDEIHFSISSRTKLISRGQSVTKG